MTDPRRFAPATERNREPIRAVLAQHLGAGARVLEIASGTGEHAAFLSRVLPVASWQPTDLDPSALAGIDAWAAHEGANNVLRAQTLDVEEPWPFATGSFDIVLAINMIHIAPWSAALALFAGAAELLDAGGLLVLYGPYREGGAHTAPSNEAFDQSLRARNARWGVRDLQQVTEEAEARGFDHAMTAKMPANNLTLVFRRRMR